MIDWSIILNFIPGISYLYRKCKPLEIKPNKKKILCSKTGNNWDEEFFVYLINYTKSSYYDINIISYYPKDVKVDIFPEISEFTFMGDEKGGLKIGTDFIIGGEDKERNENFNQIVINNINPAGERKIKIDVKKNNHIDDFIVRFKIEKFSKEPKSIFKK